MASLVDHEHELSTENARCEHAYQRRRLGGRPQQAGELVSHTPGTSTLRATTQQVLLSQTLLLRLDSNQ